MWTAADTNRLVADLGVRPPSMSPEEVDQVAGASREPLRVANERAAWVVYGPRVSTAELAIVLIERTAIVP